MLLCGIINELGKLRATNITYFFCQATDTRINTATAVLRGLIFLLVDQQPSLIRHIRVKYDEAGKRLFEDANAWVALSAILNNMLTVSPHVLVLDKSKDNEEAYTNANAGGASVPEKMVSEETDAKPDSTANRPLPGNVGDVGALPAFPSIPSFNKLGAVEMCPTNVGLPTSFNSLGTCCHTIKVAPEASEFIITSNPDKVPQATERSTVEKTHTLSIKATLDTSSFISRPGILSCRIHLIMASGKENF